MLLLVLLLLLLGLSVSSLADYLLQPETYNFGTEVGGWLYSSRLHYLGGLLAELLVLSGGLVLSFLVRSPKRILGSRLTAVLVEGAFLAGTTLLS